MCAGGATPASSWRWSAPPSVPGPVLGRFAELPQIVAVVEAQERRTLGVTVEGVPWSWWSPQPERFGTALVRATGSPAYVAALEPLPDAPDEEARLPRRWACHGARRSCAKQPFRGQPPPLVGLGQIRGDLHCHTTWSDGRASVEEMGARGPRARL